MKNNYLTHSDAGDADSGNTETCRLELYVAGATGNSLKAILNIRKILSGCIPGMFSLSVIDVYLHPDAAPKEQIVAIPTLVIKNVYPPLRLIGDMSDTDKVNKILGIE